MKTVDGKVLVITGAGSGIGRALAVAGARRGAELALSDIDETGLAETARQVGPARVRTDRLDVADREAMTAYATDVVADFGRVNVMVNNAGVALTGNLTELDDADMEWIFGINFWGVVHGSRAFLPHLIASGDGHLVNISSLFGLISVPGQSLYNASKYAVRGLSEALRAELLAARHPVGLTVVHPGGIRTAIARNGRAAQRVDQVETARLFDTRLARTTPERAAEVIWRGVERNRPRVLVGRDAHVLHNLAKFSGPRYQDVVARWQRRFGNPT